MAWEHARQSTYGVSPGGVSRGMESSVAVLLPAEAEKTEAVRRLCQTALREFRIDRPAAVEAEAAALETCSIIGEQADGEDYEVRVTIDAVRCTIRVSRAVALFARAEAHRPLETDPVLGLVPGLAQRLHFDLCEDEPGAATMERIFRRWRGQTTGSLQDLPLELRARVLAATAGTRLRSVREREPTESGAPVEYDVDAVCGDRLVHMRLWMRPDGSVGEETETCLTADVSHITYEGDHAIVSALMGGEPRHLVVGLAVARALGEAAANHAGV